MGFGGCGFRIYILYVASGLQALWALLDREGNSGVHDVRCTVLHPFLSFNAEIPHSHEPELKPQPQEEAAIIRSP